MDDRLCQEWILTTCCTDDLAGVMLSMSKLYPTVFALCFVYYYYKRYCLRVSIFKSSSIGLNVNSSF